MNAKAKAEKKPTEYVILELRAMFALPEARSWTENREHEKAKKTPTLEAWVEVGETDTAKAKSAQEKKVIASVVGNRAGTFKAVAKTAWKGGVKRAQTTIWQDEVIS